MLDMINLGQLTKKSSLFHLAKPNKDIITSIKEVSVAHIDGYGINQIPNMTLEIPAKVLSKNNGNSELVDNPILQIMKKKMLIRVKWNDRKNVNWFIINNIEKQDTEEPNVVIECLGLANELRNRQSILELKSVTPKEYFDTILKNTNWKINSLDEALNAKHRTFDENRTSILEHFHNGLETYGAIAIFNDEDRTIDIKVLESIREYRGVVLKRENFADEIIINDNAEDVVTRLYVYGEDDLTIENANPTGMPYIENFDAFLHPFERDSRKNVIKESHYMSNDLAHALLDLKEKQEEILPKIKNLRNMINNAYDDLVAKETELSDSNAEVVKAQALLDTAKAVNSGMVEIEDNKITLMIAEDINKRIQGEYDEIKNSIEEWESQITRWKNEISTAIFTEELQEELKSFVYEQEFTDNRYADAEDLYAEGLRQFAKYQNGVTNFTVTSEQFLNAVETSRYKDRVRLGEEVRIRSSLYNVDYTSMVVGYHNIDLITGDITIDFSDSLEDLHSLDKLAAIIHKGASASATLNASKTKWDGIVTVRNEVQNMREGVMNTVKNKIIAGANESITIDNKGILVTNPTNPDHMLIIQSGVMALSRDGGNIWETAVTPEGISANSIVGEMLAGEKLVITNNHGTFRIDEKGINVNADSINIWSGDGRDRENVLESWNVALSDYKNFTNDNKLNPYEKSKLRADNETIKSIFSNMIEVFKVNYVGENGEPLPKPAEYNAFVEKYNNLQAYLNTTKQSDGYAILAEGNKDVTSEINPSEFNRIMKEYEEAKATFETVIPLKFSASGLQILKDSISLNYVQNGDIISSINASEEGVQIDGSKFEINAKTNFNDDLTMNAGVIRSKDGGIIIDLNAGTVNLSKPLHINASPVATTEQLEEAKNTFATKEQIDKIKLTPGPRGVSVKSVKNYYLATIESRGITKDSSGWSTDVNTQKISADKQYLWNYEETSLDDGTSTTTEPTIVGYWGRDGVSGTSGRGINAITEYYLLSNTTSGVTHSSSGWSTTTKVPTQTNRYVWHYEKIEYTDGSEPTLTSPRVIAMFGEKGEKGLKGQDGVDGEDGNGISSVENFYKATNTNTAPTITSSGWSTTPPLTTETNRFLWNYEKISYTKTNPVNTPVSLLAVHGVSGQNGVGITGVVEFYLITTKGSGVTRSESGWTRNNVSPTNDKPYLWNYEKIDFSDNSSTYTEPVMIGYKARDGRDGSDGVAGRDGIGIRSTAISYGLSTSDTTQPTTWTAQVPTLVKGRYLWTKTVWTYTDSNTETGYTKTYIARDGNNGTDGVAGKDGVGIRSTVITYASSSSGTTQPTRGWQSQVPNVPNGQYLWTKTVWTYTDNTNETGYSVARMGSDGRDGRDGSSFNLKGTLTSTNLLPTASNSNKGDGYLINGDLHFSNGSSWINVGKIQGPAGESSHVHIAYANSADGTSGFSTTDAEGKAYMGTMLSTSRTPSNNPQDYRWISFGGNIKVGARNLIVDSSSLKFDGSNVEKLNVYNGKKDVIKVTNPSSSLVFNPVERLIEPIITGETYTYSFDVYVTQSPTGKSTQVSLSSETGGLHNVQGTITPNRWSRVHTTKTFNQNDSLKLTHNFRGFTNIYFADFQLEKGNIPTDYKKSEEDAIIAVSKIKTVNGKDGVGIKTTEITYATSTSGTVAPTSSWRNTIPNVPGGQYLWTKTVWTYTNDQTETVYSVAKAGEKGEQGEQGKSISIKGTLSSTTQLPRATTSNQGDGYLIDGNLHVSNSSTWTNVGKVQGPAGDSSHLYVAYSNSADGSVDFSTTISEGKRYMGTFSSTSSTQSTNYRDYKWIDVGGNVEVGARNLLRQSNQSTRSTSTNLQDYYLTTSPELSRDYTFTLKGSLGSNRTSFSIYNTGNNVKLADLQSVGNGLYQATFKWTNSQSGYSVNPNYIRIVQNPNNTRYAESSIEWVKLERGNKGTDWTLAPEDMSAMITTSEQAQADRLLQAEERMRAELASKNDIVALNTYEDFVQKYNLSQEEVARGIKSIETDLKSALATNAVITNTLINGAEDWIFQNTKIRMSDEGITIGDPSRGTYVQIGTERISLFGGSNDAVAYISNGMLYINQAVFVQSIRISDFMVSSEKKGHLTFRYVG